MPSPGRPLAVDKPKNKTGRRLSTPRRNQIAASWIFGVLLLAFLFYAFVFAPDVLSVIKQRILAFVCALIAGLFGFFLVGSIKVTLHPESNSDIDDKKSTSSVPSLAVEASGGFAAAVLVLIWWLSPFAPVLPAKSVEQSINIYRVRVTVLDQGELPVENSQIRSSLGGELKKVGAGWEVDIPSSNKSADGRLTLYASTADSSLRGFVELKLGGDPNLTATIRLQKDPSNFNTGGASSNEQGKSLNLESNLSRTSDSEKRSASSSSEGPTARSPSPVSSIANQGDTSIRIYGRVIDDSSRASISGVKVFIVGFEKEAVLTGAGGDFNLPAHASEGRMVRLRVEKQGYTPKEQEHPAGRVHVTILMLEK